MPQDATRELFNEIDTNHDGKIDRTELSQWTNNALDEGVGTSSTTASRSYFSRGSYGGADIRSDVGYETDANAVLDQMDLNRHHVIGRHEFNHFDSDERAVIDASSITNYLSRYSTDARGFYIDPHPEIFTRPYPGPAPTYKQNIAIRYLEPPPLPPSGQQIIREVRAPPLQAPPPFLIREPGKPGHKPPPLVFRERPPTPPPTIPPVEKNVIIPPLPAPPRSTIIEKFPNLPDHPRDIIVERWLPYKSRPPSRTVRIAAVAGPLPAPPRNKIIQYQPVEARVVRQFQRFGVTRADPQAYIREYGSSLLDSHTLLHEVRAIGVVEDISVPSGTAIGFASSSYGHTDGFNGSYIGGDSEYIISDSGKYAGGAIEYFTHDSGKHSGGASEYITHGSGIHSGAIDTAFRNADTNHDGTLSPAEFERFVHKV